MTWRERRKASTSPRCEGETVEARVTTKSCGREQRLLVDDLIKFVSGQFVKFDSGGAVSSGFFVSTSGVGNTCRDGVLAEISRGIGDGGDR